MKNLPLPLTLIALFCLSAVHSPDPGSPRGTLLDAASHAVSDARLFFYQNGRQVATLQTSARGTFEVPLRNGRYHVLASLGNRELAGWADSLTMTVDGRKPASYRLVLPVKVTRRYDASYGTNITCIERNGRREVYLATQATEPPAARSKDKSARYSIASGVRDEVELASPRPATAKYKGAVATGESSSDASASYLKTAPAGKPFVTETATKTAREAKPTPAASTPAAKALAESLKNETLDYKAGLLTAGEYNELDNWEHWTRLLAGEYQPSATNWKIMPRQRYPVVVSGQNGQTVADCTVQLQSREGKVLWENRTDNHGKAELWYQPFANEAATANLRIVALHNGKGYLADSAAAGSSAHRISISATCAYPANADIVFAVDATGSMGDEINYLKAELSDVILRVLDRNNRLNLRIGTVFYRDATDEYVTRSSPLTDDYRETLAFIRGQEAGGGGDFPEAVHSALEEAVDKQNWRPDAVARIVFLVLDAPPHQHPAVIASLQDQLKRAAAKGIKIIPVTASGIDRPTEFLMKSFAALTNGTYVFLTDHSGIGNSHLTAEADRFRVELLNDALVRIIGQYVETPDCRQLADRQNGEGGESGISFYPNPASDVVQVDLREEMDEVALFDVQGQVIRSIPHPLAGNLRLNVQDLPAGVYWLRFRKGESVQSRRLTIVRA